MNTDSLRAGKNLPSSTWSALQRRAIFDFYKWDIHCDDHHVLAPFPLLLQPETADYLNEAAESLSREVLAAELEILQQPELIAQLGLPRALRNVLQENSGLSAPAQNVRVMRFDFHPTLEGWRISEVNSDVPGGFIEASGWNALFAEKWPGTIAPPSTSNVYAQAIREATGPNAVVALVHATAYSDDRQVMRHLAKCFSTHGLQTHLLSPSHLKWHDGRAEIQTDFASGWPDAIVRFFPSEWLPKLAAENCWKAYFQGARIPLSNPGAAIISQTKRFPLVWDALRTDLSTWREFLPETRDLVDMRGPIDDCWVLKPALGRVGNGVVSRGIWSTRDFQQSLKEARRKPDEWVAQKRFSIRPLLNEEGAKYPCIGVFTINGKAAGFYGRVADNPIIGQSAQDAAVLIDRQGDRGEM